jgi:DNA topoisomerase-1
LAKSLVIVESPAKAKTINKFLGSGYSVKASMGHVKDLPKRKLGVDVANGFSATYEVLPGRKQVLDDLKKAAKKADKVLLAPDPDREGEAICFHLKEELGKVNSNIFRVLFNEITKRAVLAGIEHPTPIDQHRVDAQLARRILDRLMGYKISPLLWEKVKRGLSAGRVQSVALRIICEREKEILAFVKEEYWTITAALDSGEPPVFSAKLSKIDGKKAEVGNQDEADAITADLNQASFQITSLTAKEKKRNPQAPFITSKLQQESFRKLGFTVRKTMMIAQRLYEGRDLGERGTVGLITYMRTDSTRIAPEALKDVRGHIESRYGKDFLPSKPRTYRARKGAQEAHEAIRPTSLEFTPELLKGHLGKDEFNLYQLIWNRFVASQMESARFDTTTIDVTAGKYTLRANGSVQTFPGYLLAYQPEAESDAEAAEALPPLKEGQELKLDKLDPKQHFTQPPPRFTEASLVKELEENGIGRPSTYASILSTLQNRDYARKEQNKFTPSELGILVTDLLKDNFADLVNVEYTAKMEEWLDEIEGGKLAWSEALKDFHEKFAKDLKHAEVHMRNVKREEIPTDQVCNKCGLKMVMKWGRYGQFLACSGYPECKNTQEPNGGNGEGKAAADSIDETCEKCGSPMVIKRGRFGQFLACSGYPKCRNTKKIQYDEDGKIRQHVDRILEEEFPKCGKKLAVKEGRFGEFTACSDYPTCRFIRLKEIGVGCPKEDCSGKVVERRSKRGKLFFGCSEYPDCDFVSWYRPIDEKCPDCSRPYLLEKTTKRDGTTHFCDNKACKYKLPVSA